MARIVRASVARADCVGGLGILRARYVHKPVWRSSLEVIVIATLAGGAAYAVGGITASVTG